MNCFEVRYENEVTASLLFSFTPHYIALLQLTLYMTVSNTILRPVLHVYIVACQQRQGLQRTARAATRHGARDP